MAVTASTGTTAQAAELARAPGSDDGGLNALRTISVRWLLVLSVLLIVVPAWSFAAYVSWQYAVTERQVIEAAGRSTVRTVASAVDFRLTSIEAAMATLALSPALRSGDLAAFYKDAEALAQIQRVVVALVSPTGEQVLNTNAPFGTVLPATAPEARFAEAVASRRTQFSKVVFGNVTRRWLVTITVPVVRDDQVAHVLIVGLDSILHLGEVLAGFDLPPGWTAAILDDANVIAARRPSAERFVGQMAHPDVSAVVGEAEIGSGRARTITNDPVQVYYSRLKRSSWVALIGIPQADVDGKIRSALLPVVLAGLVVLLTSLAAAWLLGRRFTEQLVSVARYASAFRDGKKGQAPVASRISELAELKNTLENASQERTRYEQRLKGLIGDKDMLMQEVHHRVKNSLQLVRGVLSLQARSAEDPGAKAALLAAASRIMTVADVHQHLYQGHSSTEIHVGRYIRDLAGDLATSLIPPDSGRKITVDAADAIWPSEKVTTFGLILTELVTNAIKYGDGDVAISLAIDVDGHGRLVVEDQGPGFPADFDLGQGTGLGSKLVTNLIRADEGTIVIDRSVSFGRVVLSFLPTWRNEERG